MLVAPVCRDGHDHRGDRRIRQFFLLKMARAP
jgi:hypothetical protein